MGGAHIKFIDGPERNDREKLIADYTDNKVSPEEFHDRVDEQLDRLQISEDLVRDLEADYGGQVPPGALEAMRTTVIRYAKFASKLGMVKGTDWLETPQQADSVGPKAEA